MNAPVPYRPSDRDESVDSSQMLDQEFAGARNQLAEAQSREFSRQGLVVRTYVLLLAALATVGGVYLLGLGSSQQRLGAVPAFVLVATMLFALMLDLKGRRNAAAILSQVSVIPPVLMLAWLFSVEAGFGSYLFMGGLAVVVVVPDARQKSRWAILVALVVSIVVVQTVFTRENSVAPLDLATTSSLATVNRTVMSLALFALAIVLNHSVGMARRLVIRTLAVWESAANTDALTGLPNRRPVWDRAMALGEHGAPFSLVLIDIDFFKALNDTYGHDCGDEALRSVAGELSDTMRAGDLLGRWGGEEFLAVVNAIGDDAETVAERARSAVEDLVLTCSAKHEHRLTVSVGVAEFRKYDDPWAVLRSADQALYEAKQTGRNRVVRADRAQLRPDSDALEAPPS